MAEENLGGDQEVPSADPSTKSDVKDVAEFLRIARLRYSVGNSADAEDRAAAENDVDFAAGGDGQWEQEALEKRRPNDRSKPSRPVITWNMLTGPINQVCNDGRMTKPSIKATPMDGGDKDTAEFFQSRIRAIEYESDADIAYDVSRQCQVISGRGFYRVRTEYKSPRSFDQRIVIEPIDNQFSVLWSPAAKRYDLSDSDWWFINSRISRDEFKLKYGEKALEEFIAFQAADDCWATDWLGSDELVPEVEYWLRRYRKDTLYEITATRKRFLGADLEDNGLVAHEGKLYQSNNNSIEVPVRRKRAVDVPYVKQYIINGAAVLAKRDWLGSLIPIIPVWGRQMVVRGKRRTFSLIRDAKDPQRVVNLTASNIAELTAQISKTKWTVAVGQLDGHESEWDPNNPKLYKQYHAFDEHGRPYSPPIADQFEAPIQALSAQLGQGIDAVRQATAIFSAALGDRSNETSGKAIDARKVESDVGNFHFLDNEARSRKLVGRILLEVIPKIDQDQTEVSIRHENGKSEMVPINRPFQNHEGKQVHYKPTEGEYDVAISTGPSYTSQRQQAAATYGEIAKNDKAFMMIAGDKFFRALDAPGAEEIADRYEKGVIPPQFRKQEGDGQQQPIPPQFQAQMQAIMQQHDLLVQQLNTLTDELQSKKVELDSRERIARMEIDGRKEIAAMTEESKRTIALAQLESKEGIALLEQKIATVTRQLEFIQWERERTEQQAQASRDADLANRQQDHTESESARAAEMAQRQQQEAESQAEHDRELASRQADLADRQQEHTETTAAQQAELANRQQEHTEYQTDLQAEQAKAAQKQEKKGEKR